MTVKKKIAKHPETVKAAALKRVASGESVASVAKNMDLHESLIYGWRKAAMNEEAKPQGANLKDAIILLQKAKDSMMQELKSGRIKALSRSQLLTLMALDSLTGGAAL